MKNIGTFGMLALIIVAMYFMLIRPQKKRQKETDNMRNNLHVGDEVVTIGGLKGKVIKVEDDSIVVQASIDNFKIEMMKWSVSKVMRNVEKSEERISDPNEEEVASKSSPKKKK